MDIQERIDKYIAGQPEAKRADLQTLDRLIRATDPSCRLWFLDGTDATGKVVTNPNIGYGQYTMRYADGKTREFYRIGLSANTGGISVYVMGIADKKHLAQAYGPTLGKASITGYCIKFKTLADIQLGTLEAAIRYGLEYQGTPA